ncbi:putative lipid II flippase FtsW [Candidatus Falkowbacteria bacterium HGW-Falkowbacteria-1]|uniref:Probable peptidoglycan glycosyltransferase FtsW n=1 Tax=Candidatus Falkowbacteria bacterium HGW-Falkowbacteria-1 TaxID=2013768 RepID=A0A2N2E9V4_9BACT|nr:MAG: putative lipid II flippase FtsW [Candidatus Falkowbacteria bacterium HGW-Falkowbacteria-1]
MFLKNKQSVPADKYLIITVLLLIIFGLVMLFSASLAIAQSNFGDPYYYVKRQFFGLFLGLALFFFLYKIDYHFFKKYSFFALLLSFVLLILVFVPGIRNEYGTSYRWIVVFGNSFQVSEAVKLLFLFYLSAWLESRKDDLKKFSNGILPFLSVLILIGVFILRQPDLGTFLIIGFISLMVYMVAGGNSSHLFILFLLMAISVLFVFNNINSNEENSIIRSYQAERIKCLQNPDFDKNICYQVNQSMIAVGSGGLWGRGLGESRQKFNYLPEVWADSIFPVIAEEIGFIGSFILILVYFFIFVRGMIIAGRAPDLFGKSLAVGISVWIFIQAFLNIGGMINLIPMTGAPLPFVSAGGTSLLMLLVAFGILINISRQAKNNNYEGQ